MKTDRKNSMIRFIDMVNESSKNLRYEIRELHKEKKDGKMDWTFSVYQLRKKYDADKPEEEREDELSCVLYNPTDLIGAAHGFGLMWYISAKTEGDADNYDAIKPYVRFF